MRPTLATVPGVGPCGTTEMVPSSAILIEVLGGSVIGPLSPSTACPELVSSTPSAVSVQVAVAGVGLLAVRSLHRDESLPLDGDIERPAGRGDRALAG